MLFLGAEAKAATLDLTYLERPQSLTVIDQDHFFGETVTGSRFAQYRIVTDATIRIHKFVISDRHFYISDRGYIEARDDLSAVSIYLSLG